MSGYSPDLSLTQKVEVLETLDVEARLRLVLGWARDTLADLTLREKIKTDVEEGMEKTQREFLLRRQLDAIRKELGRARAATSDDDDPDDYRAKLEARDLPEHVRKAVEREVDKLERTSDQSPETGWIRTWLDTVLEIPWGVESEDRLDIAEASRILEADHDGLEDVKERILEHLAVRKLQAERGLAPVDGRGSGAILALVGPPGRRQDVARRVRGQRPRAQVRPGLAGRRARRGRDPRPPPHLRRGPAGPPGARPARGRDHEPGHRARRGRQDRRRLPGRPVLGAARGARPGAEPHVP